MNTSSTGFYITLPSDSSKDLFPKNNPSEYMVKLPRWVQLNGEWEVGLHSIAYTQWDIVQHRGEPIRWLLKKDDGSYIKEKGKRLKNYYASIEEYVSDINKSTRYDDDMIFSIQNGKVTIALSKALIHKVILRREQAIILGFMKFDDPEDVKEIATTETGLYNANLHRESNIHVYCDIIRPQIVGDKTTPLLAIIPDQKVKATYETVYAVENIHYIPIQTKSFQNIKVLLRSSTNESIPFNHGRATITLHLRPLSFF